jgi:predicted RNA-binding protein YlxR (DUF448 family)
MSGKLHQPVRMCVVCRERLPKSQMRRYGLNNNQVVHDKFQSQSNRGVYVCSQSCYDKVHYNLGKILVHSKKSVKP